MARSQVTASLGNVHNPTLRQADEVGGGNAEHGIRRAGRRPYVGKTLKVAVNQNNGPAGVTNGRHSADLKISALAISATVQPMAEAASCDVRVLASNSNTWKSGPSTA